MFAEDLELMPLPLGAEGVEVFLLDLTQLADLEATASQVLTRAEGDEYARLGHPMRRREWLGARAGLKAILLRRACVREASQCEIRKDARGRPWIAFAPGVPAAGIRDCSISHTGRFACVGVSIRTDAHIGVDVEEISPRLLKVAAAFAGDRQSRLGAPAAEERLAVLWALKEACAKAMGGGIGMALRDVCCEETAEGRHRVRTGDGRELRAWHLERDGHVIALGLGRQPNLRDGRPSSTAADNHKRESS